MGRLEILISIEGTICANFAHFQRERQKKTLKEVTHG